MSSGLRGSASNSSCSLAGGTGQRAAADEEYAELDSELVSGDKAVQVASSSSSSTPFTQIELARLGSNPDEASRRDGELPASAGHSNNNEREPSLSGCQILRAEELLPLSDRLLGQGDGLAPPRGGRNQSAPSDLAAAGRDGEGQCESDQLCPRDQKPAKHPSDQYSKSPQPQAMSVSTSFRYCRETHKNNTRVGEQQYSNHADKTSHPMPEATQQQASFMPASRAETRGVGAASGFGEVQPKLAFATKRMKEYFESFKTSHDRTRAYESRHLYQFYKAARTELVASLLISLIVCYTLICCRVDSHLKPERAQVASWSPLRVQLITATVAALTVATLTQILGHISGCHMIPSVSLALYFKGHISRARLISYLIAQSSGSLLGIALLGLLTSSSRLQEASLHITITSSAPNPMSANYQGQESGLGVWAHSASGPFGAAPQRASRRLDLAPLPAGGGNPNLASKSENSSSASWPPSPPLVENIERRRRRKRSDDSLAAESRLGEGSESILVSIMEQRERQLEARRDAQRRNQRPNRAKPDDGPQGSPKRFDMAAENQTPASGHHDISGEGLLGVKTSNSGGGGSGGVAGEITLKLFRSNNTATSSGGPSDGDPNGPRQPPEQPARRNISARPTIDSIAGGPLPLGDKNDAGTSKVAAVEVQISSLATTATDFQQASPTPPARLVMVRVQDEFASAPISSHELPTRIRDQLSDGGNPKLPLVQTSEFNEETNRLANGPASNGTRALKRKLRARRQPKPTTSPDLVQTNQNSPTSDGEPVSSRVDDSNGIGRRVVNLLGFAQPEQIMSSDSIEKCLKESNQRRRSKERHDDENASWSCLSLSNGSQMLIFQLLATLLIDLAYLANVDPRRTDLGHRSLSIGIAYFLAHCLCLNSGGFIGQPFQLIGVWVLATKAPASPTDDQQQWVSWQAEWVIYLVSPLIGGLFSALSHDYIDFTSPAKQSKQLHLRRSFCSLDNLGLAVRAQVCCNCHQPRHQSNNENNETALELSTSNTDGEEEEEEEDEMGSCRPRLTSESLEDTEATQMDQEAPDHREGRHLVRGATGRQRLASMVRCSAMAADSLKDQVASRSRGSLANDLRNTNSINQLNGCANQQIHQESPSSAGSGGVFSQAGRRRQHSGERQRAILLDSNFLMGYPMGGQPVALTSYAHKRSSSGGSSLVQINRHQPEDSFNHGHNGYHQHAHQIHSHGEAQICTSQFM